MPGSGFLFHHVQKQVYTAAGDFIHRLFHRGQTGNREPADINTVKTDDADIIGYILAIFFIIFCAIFDNNFKILYNIFTI